MLEYLLLSQRLKLRIGNQWAQEKEWATTQRNEIKNNDELSYSIIITSQIIKWLRDSNWSYRWIRIITTELIFSNPSLKKSPSWKHFVNF
jgi:hypothetical protein